MLIDFCYGDAKPSVHPVTLSCTPFLLVISFVGILIGYTLAGMI